MAALNVILSIAYRDLLKFLRDRARIISTFIFPIIFIAILGQSLQANLGQGLGYNFIVFTFTGVFAQTLFQSAAFGVISLIEDRENDFSQEIFVSPISRYAIVFGKIVGESTVALVQGIGIVLFGFVVGVPLSVPQLISLLPVGIAVCLVGAAFGVLILSNLGSRRAADQVFNFIMLPQYFLAGIFNPIRVLPAYADILSRISPLRYAVDLTRGIFYSGQTEYSKVVLADPALNTIIMVGMFLVFLVVGTWLFIRGERNR